MPQSELSCPFALNFPPIPPPMAERIYPCPGAFVLFVSFDPSASGCCFLSGITFCCELVPCCYLSQGASRSDLLSFSLADRTFPEEKTYSVLLFCSKHIFSHLGPSLSFFFFLLGVPPRSMGRHAADFGSLSFVPPQLFCKALTTRWFSRR